jgi:hypothetical protein
MPLFWGVKPILPPGKHPEKDGKISVFFSPCIMRFEDLRKFQGEIEQKSAIFYGFGAFCTGEI